MDAVEFKTTVKDGIIRIPERYKKSIGTTVKVILLSTPRKKQPDAVSKLLASPVILKKITPMSRDEAHERF
jgi:hypothetical protein